MAVLIKEKRREKKGNKGAQGKVKEEVFLIHRSLWNADRIPGIVCWNSFFLFSLEGIALFSFRSFQIEREDRFSSRSLDLLVARLGPASTIYPVLQLARKQMNAMLMLHG
jgi:hypothetical protein